MARSSAGLLITGLISIFSLFHATEGAITKNSVPFDPFRLECPFYHGVVKMDLRRVESSEAIRSDTMVTAHCENVKKLHPSPRDQTAAPNDENCRWTAVFTIPGKNIDVTTTCFGKEFVAGVARQDLGEYNILCCKLKDRKRGECSTAGFPWPIAESPQTSVEHRKRLLSSIGFFNGQLIGQFCEYEIMSKEELEAEIRANSQTLLLTEFGQEGGKGSGTIRQKVTGRLRELDRGSTIRHVTAPKSPPRTSPRARNTTPQIKSTTTRPRARQTTPASYEYEYGDASADVEQGKGNGKSDGNGNGVVHVINDPNAPPTPLDDAQPITAKPKATTSATTTTKRTTTTTRTTPSTTSTTTTTTTEAPLEEETTPAESTTSTAEETTATTTVLDDEYPDEGAQTTGASSPSATPVSARKVTSTTQASTSTSTTEEPDFDKPFGATVPDPSRFQVLGVLKSPQSSLTIKNVSPKFPQTTQKETTQSQTTPQEKAKAHFLQPPTSAPSKIKFTIKKTTPSATTDTSEATTTLAPAPSFQTGEGSGDVTDMEHEASSAVSSLSTALAQNETTEAQTDTTTVAPDPTRFIELVTPPVPVGKLNADTQDSAILLGNDTVESAVAPPLPQFGTRIPIRKWKTLGLTTTVAVPAAENNTSVVEGKVTVAADLDAINVTVTEVVTQPAAATEGAVGATRSTDGGSGTTGRRNGGTTSIAEEADKIECDTAHASTDPVTKLVVACGQGKDIWSPPRCPENTFCLVAKDSTFRICCPVQVLRKH